MDAENSIEPKLMWKPDPSKGTKMDLLGKKINSKYNVELG